MNFVAFLLGGCLLYRLTRGLLSFSGQRAASRKGKGGSGGSGGRRHAGQAGPFRSQDDRITLANPGGAKEVKFEKEEEARP